MTTDLAAVIFGGGFDNISKAEPDSADVKSQKRDKRLARVGVGANALAIAGGVHALGAAAAHKNLGLKEAGPVARKIHAGGQQFERGMGKVVPVKALNWAKNPRNAAKLAVGAVGLHVAELGGDAISHKFLHEASKKKVEKYDKYEAIADVAGYGLTSSPAVNANTKAHQYKSKVKARRRKGRLKELAKSDHVDIEFAGTLSKLDTDKRQVFGWASVTKMDGQDVLDRQGDYIALEEIEKSAYHYVHNSRKGGDMHQRDGEVPLHKSDMIESFVVTPEKLAKMGLPEDALPHGWWVGYQVNDEGLWGMVKDGKRVGFSIHGKGIRTPMES